MEIKVVFVISKWFLTPLSVFVINYLLRGKECHLSGFLFFIFVQVLIVVRFWCVFRSLRFKIKI